MTAQVLDGLRVDGIGYCLVQAEPGPFSPWDYGIEPNSICSSNWAGYVAGFEVLGRRLYLASLSVGWAPPRRITGRDPAGDDPLGLLAVGGPQELPALNGVMPESSTGSYMAYSNVQLPLDYTGRLIGCMGDVAAPKPDDCRVFVFEAGILVDTQVVQSVF
ncbi:hypothetical protein [Marinobacter daepoensis]|uniref:hypothetical protein n=1 Tax=Marinobacter daepoensis TaxID=262077 RepID=UPI0004128660|nr:hypothetical protein [Marinobacter daepoensis]